MRDADMSLRDPGDWMVTQLAEHMLTLCLTQENMKWSLWMEHMNDIKQM